MNEEFNKALKQLDEQLKQTNSVKKLFDNIEYIKYDGLENLTDEFYSQSVKTPPRNFTNKDGVNKQKEFYALQDLVREYEYLFRTIPYGIFYLADDIKRPMLVIGQIIRVNGSSEFMKNDVIYCLGTIIFNSSHYSQDFYIEHYGREVIVGNKDVLVRPPTFLNKEEHSYGRWREYGYRKDIERKKLLKSKLEEIFAYREDYLEGLKNEADEIQVQAIEQTIKRHCERLNKKANNWEYELSK